MHLTVGKFEQVGFYAVVPEYGVYLKNDVVPGGSWAYLATDGAYFPTLESLLTTVRSCFSRETVYLTRSEVHGHFPEALPPRACGREVGK